jgi:hypothetical protein
MVKQKPKGLVALERKVQQWRQSRKGRRGRIPESLWAEAVAVARTAGLYQTSKAVRFHYGALKKRAAQAPEAEAPRKPEFVAVEMPHIQCEGNVTVDLVRPDGSQMRIEAAGGLDVSRLVESFLWRAT